MTKTISLIFICFLFFECNSTENNTNLNQSTDTKIKDELVEATEKKMVSETYAKIDELIAKANKEFKLNKGSELGYSYWYDSIPNQLINTYVENLIFKKNDGSSFDFSKIKKPIFLQFTSAWSYPNKTEIPALNKIVEEYTDQIEFVLILNEDLEHLQGKEKNYNKNINLIPHEKWPDSDKIVFDEINISGFRHNLGFPFNYLISSDNQIVHAELGDVDTRNKNYTSKQIFDKNYQKMNTQVEKLLNHQKSK